MTTARATMPGRSANRLLAKVHVAKRELDMDDSDYRDVLERHGGPGKRSAKDLTDAQLIKVLKEFEAKGFKPKVVGGGKTTTRSSPKARRAPADHPVAKKARAMWISLHKLGVVENRSEAALEAFAKRQLGVEVFQWADQGQGYKLIEALKKWAEREAGWDQSGTLEDVLARLDQLLKARGRG